MVARPSIRIYRRLFSDGRVVGDRSCDWSVTTCLATRAAIGTATGAAIGAVTGAAKPGAATKAATAAATGVATRMAIGATPYLTILHNYFHLSLRQRSNLNLVLYRIFWQGGHGCATLQSGKNQNQQPF